MARRHRGPSLRSAHWNEAKHPRDDRGRFARKGGGRWLAKVAKDVQARFGDIGMGAAPGSEPRGRLSTGKGGLIDTKAISRGAPRIKSRTPLGPVEAPGGRVGRTAAGALTHPTGKPATGGRLLEQRDLTDNLGEKYTRAALERVRAKVAERETGQVGRTATGVKGAVAAAAPPAGGHAAPPRVARLASGVDKSRVSTQADRMTSARAAAKERRVSDLNMSTDPKDNAAKVKAMENGDLAGVQLYRKALSGPSGQRSNIPVGTVRHTPDHPSGEFRVSDKDGHLTGWASRTMHDGEPMYSLHSENYDGGQEFVGWTDSLATGADILNNGEFAATKHGNSDSRRTSMGRFVPNPNRGKTTEQLDAEAARREYNQSRQRLTTGRLGPQMQAAHEKTVRDYEAAHGIPSTLPRSATDVEAELAAAREALANVDPGIGGGSLRSKAHGRRVNAGVGRAAEASARVTALEKELRSLRGESEPTTPVITPRQISRTEELSKIDRAEFDAMSPEARAGIADELHAMRHGSDETQRGIAAYTLGKLGLAPTPAERVAVVSTTPAATPAAGREFSMQELKQILAGDSGFAHNAIRPTDEHRRLLEAAGATPAQSEAIMKKLGANTESGHLTADVSMALHFGAMREAADQADAARSAKLLEATPRAYAGLLGDGKGAVTHPRSRQVIEAMQTNGWVLKDMQAGGISTWGPPGDDSKSLVMISGRDRPSFMAGNQKLSGAKAIEHVGGPAPAKPNGPTRTNRARRTGNADGANTEPGNATPAGLRTNQLARPQLRTNEFGFPQTEGPARPPVSHEERRAASLATRDGIPPKDGRPDITALATSNSKNDYHRWSLSTSEGRDPTMAPDVARTSGGVLDNKAVSAVVMNPKDGSGDYRYRIVEEGTGQVLEEGSGHDAGEVFRKADRIFSSQRGGGVARTQGNEVHYVARSQERPKDVSRGDFGRGPFYDFTVNEVDRNGNERTVVKTNSMDRAHAQAAAMNAKEQGATERAAAALAESRRHSMADIYNRHRDLTRAQFDALPADEQQRVLNDLRKVRDSKEQVSSTIASNRTSMGTTLRGTKNAPHVDAAQAKLRELTYTAPPPPDNSIEAQRARLSRGFASGSKEQLNQASIDAGLGGIPTSWKLDKMRDYLRARANAGDLYDQAFDTNSGRLDPGKLAEALRQASSREQAAGLLDSIDLNHGLTTANMQAAAGQLGGTLRGSKRKHRDDLIELSVGRRADSAAIERTALGRTGRTATGVVGAPNSGFAEPPAAPSKHAKLSDEQVRQGLVMRGTTDAALVAEAQRRGIDVNAPAPNAEGGNFAAELRGGLGAGDQLARETALRTSVASNAQERKLRAQAEEANRRLRDVGSREEAQAELAGMSVEQLKELARVLNVRRDGANKDELKSRIVERTVGSRLNAGVLGDPESLRSRAPDVPAPGSASSGRVELENLNQGDHVRVAGVDQYGHPTSLNGYVQGKPGQVTMRKGRTRKAMYAVQVSDTPSGGGANFRGVVYVEPGQLAERTEPGAGGVGPKGEARLGRTASGLTQVDTQSVSGETGGMTATTPYTVGQRVEVLAHNFSKPGMPREWKSGTVTSVERQENGRHDVMVTADDGTRHPQIVGVRGGNNSLRSVQESSGNTTATNAPATPAADMATEALPGGSASLGVRNTSKGRETVVTLPDGTVARRTSKTKAYTHAVVATVDNHRVAQTHREQATQEQAYVNALQAWIDRGANIGELKAYPTAGLSDYERRNGRSNKEYFLPGFGPTQETTRRSRYGGGGTYLADHKQYGIPDPNDKVVFNYTHDTKDNGKTKYEVYGPEYLLDHHRRNAQRHNEVAAKLEAGPQYSYHVARWSQSRSNATAALGSQDLGGDRPGYTLRVVGIEGATEGKSAPETPFGVFPSRLGGLTPADAQEAYQFLRSHQLTPAEADAYINSLKAKELRKLAGHAGMLAADRAPLDMVKQRVAGFATREAR